MKELHRWFQENQRPFPWREERTPYRVWISEVMLQQTRASVVVAYFEQWMQLFPNVQSLANAPLEQVIKAWEGLGYYSRARNLHVGAKLIIEKFGGKIPSTAEGLSQIKGLGPYTIGAILSFGFQKKAPAVDGNVIRVLTRYFAIEEEVQKKKTQSTLQILAEGILDPVKPWVTAEALIELGASICTPKPRCDLCPLSKGCLALLKKRVLDFPYKKPNVKPLYIYRAVAWIECDGWVLVRKGEAGKVMADLFEFPYLEMEGKKWTNRSFQKRGEKAWGLKLQMLNKLPVVRHTFTRYRAELFPVCFSAKKRPSVSGMQWIQRESLSTLPFSSGHRKILLALLR